MGITCRLRHDDVETQSPNIELPHWELVDIVASRLGLFWSIAFLGDVPAALEMLRYPVILLRGLISCAVEYLIIIETCYGERPRICSLDSIKVE